MNDEEIKNCIGSLLKTAHIKKKYRELLLSPKSLSYLSTACTDASDNNENNLLFLHSLGSVTMNQTFVAYLVQTYPEYTSAQITNMKKNFFKDYPNKIAEYAMSIGVDKLIMYDSSKIKVVTTKMIQKVFEAIIGAIELFINKECKEGLGYIVVRKLCYFVYSMIDISSENDPITLLKELYQSELNGHIQQIEFTKDEDNIFKAEIYDEVEIGKKKTRKLKIGEGLGRQKAIAQDEASKAALAYFKEQGIVRKPKFFSIKHIDPRLIHHAPRDARFTSFILHLLDIVKDVKLTPDDMEIFSKAFTHPDANPDPRRNFEVLETLGDNLANKCVLWYLSSRFPQLNGPHGIDIMTKMKINIIQTSGYSTIADELGFYDFISAQKSINVTEKKKLLEDVFEATFAAIELVLDRKYKPGMGFIVCYRLLSTILDKKDIRINYEEIVDARTRLKETFDLYKNIKVKFETRCKANDQDCTSYLYEARVNGKDQDDKDTYGPFLQVGDRTFNGKANTKAEAEEILAKKAIEYYKSIGIVKRIPNEYLKFCV
jgi:dsRNA-specific ribonuclease